MAVREQKGKHAFKFIVDDEWRFAPDQPTVADIEGRVNNFIDVSDFVGYTGEENFEANRLKVRGFCGFLFWPNRNFFFCVGVAGGELLLLMMSKAFLIHAWMKFS